MLMDKSYSKAIKWAHNACRHNQPPTVSFGHLQCEAKCDEIEESFSAELIEVKTPEDQCGINTYTAEEHTGLLQQASQVVRRALMAVR
jgi:hypothetical protein